MIILMLIYNLFFFINFFNRITISNYWIQFQNLSFNFIQFYFFDAVLFQKNFYNSINKNWIQFYQEYHETPFYRAVVDEQIDIINLLLAKDNTNINTPSILIKI